MSEEKKEKKEKEAGKSSATVLKELRTRYGRGLPTLDELELLKLVLDNPKINLAMGGGSPIGRIIELFGPESGGKTTIACAIGGCFQRRKDKPKQNKVLFIDMEQAFNKKHAQTVGLSLDPSLCTIVQPLCGEEGFEIAEALLMTGEYGLIVWDSIATTSSASQMKDEYGKANVGASAKVFSEGLKKINPYLNRYQVTMITINQIRDKIGGFMPAFGKQESTPGGHAPKFYASWRARISRGEDIVVKNEVIGNSIIIRNVKSKICPPKRKVQVDLYYATGLNPEEEYLDFIIDLGIVTKAGSWLSNEEWGFKGQGKPSLLSFLRDNPELFEKVKKQVTASFSTRSVLDDIYSEELTEEELEEAEEDE